MTVPAEFVSFAHRLADAAAVVQRRYFRTPISVDTKTDESPVTIADRESEAVMRDLIGRNWPGHGILGEEHGSTALDAEWVWSLDPVDGTKAFISGKPQFGTLIALCHAGRPVLGIVDQSIIRERWVGGQGHAATLNGKAIQCRACPSLEQATIFTTSPRAFAAGSERAAFDRVVSRARLPMYGGDCYNYALVASGFGDLVVEAGLKPFDYLALVPLLEAAGGGLTDWRGQVPGLVSDGRVVAFGDAAAQAEVLALLAAD